MRRSVRAILTIAITFGLLAIFFRNADLQRVWESVVDARWDLLGAATGCVILSQLARIWRWRTLIAPIGRVHFYSIFLAAMMGTAVSTLLPGRAGELLRPYFLARREGLSTASVFATVVLDRILDILAVLFIFAFVNLAWNPLTPAVEHHTFSEVVRVSAQIAAIAVLLTLIAAYLAARRPTGVGSIVGFVTQWLPQRIAEAITKPVERFAAGFMVLRRPFEFVVAVVWSLFAWLGFLVSLWLVSSAFGIELTATGAATLQLMTLVGVSVPTPAGIGGFHAAYQVGAVTLYGANVDASVGAALFLHAISFVPPTLVGVIVMVAVGITPNSIEKIEVDNTSSLERDDEPG